MARPSRIYLDYQATTPVADDVLAEMLPFFQEKFANPHSSEHAMGWEAATAVETATRRVARFIGADPDEVVFTSGATESNNLALIGVARRARISGLTRNRILLSSIEHKSILAVGRVLEEQYGFSIGLIPMDREGRLVRNEFAKLLGSDVLLVSVMAVNNEIGSIQDLATIGEMTRSCGALFHCDAAQGALAIEMRELALHVDLASLSGHKMYAPKGIGALYIRREVQSYVEPIIYGGGQQNGFRSGTIPTTLCVGMGAAADFLMSTRTQEQIRSLRCLRDKFVQSLLSLPFPVKTYGPEVGDRHPGNISVSFAGVNAQDILSSIQPSVAASTGSACASGIPEPSHVLTAIGVPPDEARTVLRLSLGLGTTQDELDFFLFRIGDIVLALREVGA